MRKYVLFIAAALVANVCRAQLADNFSDGNFTANPPWGGTTTHFIVNASQQLQLNNSVAGTSYLSSVFNSSFTADLEWIFFIRQSFAPSDNNYGRVYLASSQADLTQPLNGYYLQFGEAGSADAIELFRQTGTTRTSVCRASNGSIAAAFDVRVKVTRTSTGMWTIFADYTGGSNFVQEATGSDATHTSSAVGGVVCVYTVSNANRFFFDDFYFGPPLGDVTPPTVTDVQAASATEVLVTFSEALQAASAQTTSNYSVNGGIGTPLSAVLQANLNTVKLVLANALVNGVTYQISTSGVRDVAGNTMAPDQRSVLFFVPQPVALNDVVINEFFPDPSPVIGLPAHEFVELYNRSTNPIDLAGWKLADLTTTATLPAFILLPQQFVILTTTTGAPEFAPFGATLGVANFPTLNNSGDVIKILTSSGLKIDSLQYTLSWYQDADKEQGGYSIEKLDPTLSALNPNHWRASTDASGGTPGRANSVLGLKPDSTPPLIVEVTVLTNSELKVDFSEEVAAATATQVANYTLGNSNENPILATLTNQNKSVIIFFANPFTNGAELRLHVANVTDTSDNVMIPAERSVRYFVPTPVKFKDVVFSEFMADPSPVVQLPEVEFIELYNRAAYPIDLGGWKLTDATGSATLPSFVLLPKGFVILTSLAGASALQAFKPVLSTPSFPSLNNTGEPLVLRAPDNRLIDSLQYTLSWYRNAEKAEGGWTLELIDTENICGEEDNWAASEDVSGGTPGRINSISANKPDLTGPRLLSGIALSKSQLELTFNEKLETTLSTTSFTLIPALAVAQVVFADISLRKVRMALAQPMAERTLYEIIVTSLRDCAGNTIQGDANKIVLALPEKAEAADVVINEILFNPRPTGVDFVELLNTSGKYINLKNWMLANFDAAGLQNEKSIATDNYLLAPGDYAVITPDAENIKSFYPGSANSRFLSADLPSMPDDEGQLVLLNNDLAPVDTAIYSRQFHNELLRDDEGVSLERIQATGRAQLASHWQSATADVGFATPGYRNAASRPEADLPTGQVIVTPEVFSPRATGSHFVSINYRFGESSYLANVKILDAQGRQVKQLVSNYSLGFEGSLRWDGDNEHGRQVRAGAYVVWFEVFALDGHVQRFRKRVVVAVP
jgi:hypothetical protein